MVEKFIEQQDIQKLATVFPDKATNGFYNAVPLIPEDRLDDILSFTEVSGKSSFCQGGICLEAERDENGQVVLFAEENTDYIENNGWVESLVSDPEMLAHVEGVVVSTVYKVAGTSNEQFPMKLVKDSINGCKDIIESLRQKKSSQEDSLVNEDARSKFITMIRNVSTLNTTLRVSGRETVPAPEITDNVLRKRLGLSPLKPINRD